MNLWQAEIDRAKIADYRDFKTAEAAGFSPEDLVDDDQTRCRSEGGGCVRADFSASFIHPQPCRARPISLYSARGSRFRLAAPSDLPRVYPPVCSQSEEARPPIFSAAGAIRARPTPA